MYDNTDHTYAVLNKNNDWRPILNFTGNCYRHNVAFTVEHAFDYHFCDLVTDRLSEV